MEIKKMIPYIVISKRKNYFRINLVKEMKSLHTKFKASLKISSLKERKKQAKLSKSQLMEWEETVTKHLSDWRVNVKYVKNSCNLATENNPVRNGALT